MSDFTERLRHLPIDTLLALSFFSVLPVRTASASFDLARIAGAWPLAGLLIAVAPAALIAINAWLGIPALVSAFVAVTAGIAMTGALHEDGLADTFDGLGGRGKRRRLEIMRDSRLGTFGALALMLAILLKGTAIAALAAHPSRAVLAILGVAIISRALALWHWSDTLPARNDGLAFNGGKPDTIAMQIGLLSGLVAAIVLIAYFGFAALLGIVPAALAIWLYSPLVARRIGGHTGDTIGAAEQIAETLIFVGLSSASATIFA